MIATLVGFFCSTLCSAVLTIGGHATPYDPYSTVPVTFYGVQVGVYLDDTQPNQCADAVIERRKWRLVIAGNATNDSECSAATVNAREWYPFGCGSAAFWGPVPSAQAYILQRSFAWPGCRRAAPRQRRHLLRAALAHHPLFIFYY